MEPVRFGVIGLGFFGEKHVKALSGIAGVEVSAVCTRREWRLKEFAEAYHVPNAYQDYRDLLADDRIDAVNIVTHVHDHLAPALAAIEAGKHVFIEKPMAASVEQCDRIIEAASKSDRAVMVGHICRFDPRYATARRRVADGDIGRIVSIYARRNIPRNVSERPLANLSPIFGDAIHDVDLALWLTGDSVASVYAQTESVRKLPNPDLGWVMYRMDSGAIVTLESNWFLPENTPYELDARMEIIGTDGAIYIDGSDRSLFVNSPSGDKNHDVTYWPVVHGRLVGALRDELAYFADCVRNGTSPDVITLPESRAAVAAVQAAEESAATNSVVRMQG